MKKIRISRRDLIRAKGNSRDERLSEVAGEFTLTSSSDLDELVVRIMSISQEPKEEGGKTNEQKQ